MSTVSAKASCIDSTAPAEAVFAAEVKRMQAENIKPHEQLTLSTSFYRGAHAVLLVYDISSRSSFVTMERWFQEAEKWTVDGIPMCLVGAKLDKADDVDAGREVSTEEGRELADEHGALFVEASSKTRENVRRAFFETVDAVVSTPGLMEKVDRIL